MAEEEKKIESSEEDKKSESEKEEEKSESKKEEEKSEEEESKESDFEKDDKVVEVNRYNQAVRKQRELELEKRELESKLAEKGEKPKGEKEDEEDDESFFDEEKEEKKFPDVSKVVDEKLKPLVDTLKKRDESERKVARTAFFEAHPEYLNSTEKWQELIDEMDNSLNPNSGDDHYTQLEKAHRILSVDSYNAEIEDKKKEIAGEAASGGGAEKRSAKEEFTAEQRKHMEDFSISEEGMRAYNKGVKEGKIQILS